MENNMAMEYPMFVINANKQQGVKDVLKWGYVGKLLK